MADVEIYSSDSQLSSDEYSPEEDDDALMNVAVSKQKQSDSKSSTSNYTSPAKSSSTGASASSTSTPRKLSSDVEMPRKALPPASREQTDLQIKYLQQKSKLYLLYKRRSMKWLAQRQHRANGYLEQLKTSLMITRERAERIAQYRKAKHAIELELQLRQQMQQRRERTQSKSPELICLDDTENEESPEKKAEVIDEPAVEQAEEKAELQQEKAASGQQQVEEVEESTVASKNGMELDEFLTLKTPKAETNFEASTAAFAAVYDAMEPAELELVSSVNLPTLETFNSVSATPDELSKLQPQPQQSCILETLKRRRSVTPPAMALPANEKRNKLAPAHEIDDIVELMPNEMPAAQHPATPDAAPQEVPQLTNIVTPRLKSESTNVPTFKLGSPFSLAPTSNEFYALQEPGQATQELASMESYSLDTPTPTPAQAMEVSYPSEKTPPAPPVASCSYAEPNSVKKPMPLLEASTAPMTATFATPYAIPQQQQQQRLKSRAEHVSKQTQTAQPPATATRSFTTKSSADLNNSDAAFHQRIKDLYSELDEIMTDKVRSVKPELKSYGEEKQRIEADIKTLDNLISQKEEEHNRLLHLRCIKEELHARLERKERILIMKEILPPILNKNCSTAELYEMHALLVKEQNTPAATRYGTSSLEQLTNKLERSQEDIKLWRSALGLTEPARSAAEPTQHRRSSMPAMRDARLGKPPPPPPPAPAANRSAVYGRQGAVRDVRGMIEDHRREHPEELPLVGKRTRYQQLISESKHLTNSTPNLSAADRNNSLENHFHNDHTMEPLYNSSPLATVYQRNQKLRNDARMPNYNDAHSLYNSHGSSELESARLLVQQLEGRAARNECNSSAAHKRSAASTNGPDELERRCQHCERYEATYMCAGCQNQWYCSRECQLRAWDDTHWASCAN